MGGLDSFGGGLVPPAATVVPSGGGGRVMRPGRRP
jgi:hypothetical protein